MNSEARRSISRRSLLRGAMGIGAGTVVAAMLSACGDSEGEPDGESQEPISAGIAGGASASTPRPLFVSDPTATPASTSAAEPTTTPTPSPTATPTARPIILQVATDWDRAIIAPLVQLFADGTGIDVELNQRDEAVIVDELLAGSDADVLLSSDAGLMGPLADAGLLSPIDGSIAGLVEQRFRATTGEWVGVSGRSLVFVYNASRIQPDALPVSIMDLASPRWRSLLGLAPETPEFAALLGAIAQLEGVEVAEDWLAVVTANRPAMFASAAELVQAVAVGEVAAGIASHTDLLTVPGDETSLGGHWFGEVEGDDPGQTGDAGALMFVRAAAVLESASAPDAAEQFVEFLLSPEAQQLLVETSLEYPLLPAVAADPRIPALDRLQTPAIDFTALASGDVAEDLLQGIAAD